MHGSLARGEFVRLAYRLGRGAATGALEVLEPGADRHRLYLRRGYLAAAHVEGVWAPVGLRRQAELKLERLAAVIGGEYRFDPHAPPPPAHAGGQPIAVTTWARRHLEARLDALRARALATELAGARLALRKHLAPEANDCDDTDRRLIEALASPRRLDELEQLSRAPRFRVLAFVHFLRSVGALDLAGVAASPPPPRPAAADPMANARRLLGVPPGADAQSVKRAYRRLARAFHPDAHPGADEAAQRAMAARFVAITLAYRSLSR